MLLLVIGLLIWVTVHLFPSVFKNARSNIIGKIGLGPYKGLFALLILLSIVLIVFGWRSTTYQDIYYPPVWGRHVTYLLVLVTFILFAAAKSKTNIKRFLRHPQLTGLVLWSVGHLFANGDNRSVILFITLGVWAIVEIILINRREGAWRKPQAVSIKNDVITLIKGSVGYVILMFLHTYITGIALMT